MMTNFLRLIHIIPLIFFAIFEVSCDKTETFEYILNLHTDEQISHMSSKELKKYETQLAKAGEFFKKESFDEYTMLTLVKIGKIQMNSKQFLNSLVSLKSALSYAEKIGDIYTEAEIYRLMASIYRFCYEPTEAIKCLQKSEAIFAETNDTLSRYRVLMDIGSICLDLQDYKKSEHYFNTVIVWAKSCKDSVLLGRCMTKHARMLVKKPDPNPTLAIKLMQEAKSKYGVKLTVDDISTLAYAYDLIGNDKLAQNTIREAGEAADDVTSRLIQSYWKYKINEENLTSDEHQQWQKVIDSLRAIVIDEAMQNSIQAAEIDYYRTQSNDSEQQLTSQSNKIKFLLAIFIPVLVICIVSALIFLRHNKRKISKYKKSLASLSEDNRNLIEHKDEYYRKVRNGELVSVLNEMIEIYYESGRSVIAKDAVFSLLESFIMSAKNEKSLLLEMEKKVNLLSDDIITKLREECPNLNANDYRLFTLLAMGFSFVSIGVIMSLEPEQVYRHKYRLKQKIKSSGTQNSEYFLSVLS